MPELSSRRTIPKGAQLSHVSELFELSAEDQERTFIWLGGESPYSSWMNVASLCRIPHPMREAHLSSCPSSMIVVTKVDP